MSEIKSEFTRDEVLKIIGNIMFDVWDVIDKAEKEQERIAKDYALEAITAPKDKEEDYKNTALKYVAKANMLNTINTALVNKRVIYRTDFLNDEQSKV